MDEKYVRAAYDEAVAKARRLARTEPTREAFGSRGWSEQRLVRGQPCRVDFSFEVTIASDASDMRLVTLRCAADIRSQDGSDLFATGQIQIADDFRAWRHGLEPWECKKGALADAGHKANRNPLFRGYAARREAEDIRASTAPAARSRSAPSL